MLYFSTSWTHLRDDGILMVDYLQKRDKQTYYVSPFRQLRENSNPSATQKLSNCVLFHQNNVPLQKYVIAMATINANGFDLIANPPYLPAFSSPSGFHLFPTLEKVIVGTNFWSDDDVIHTVRSSQ